MPCHHPSPAYRFNAALAILFLLAGSARGASLLRIFFPDDLPRVEAKLRLYVWTPGRDWPAVYAEWPIGDRNDFQFPINNGVYGVEVVGQNNSYVLNSRKSKFIVKGRTTVELAAARIPYSVNIADKDVRPNQIALRRIGAGEIRWKQAAPDRNEPPTLLLSPAESLIASCVADTPNTLIALWRRVTPKAGEPIIFSDKLATFEVSASVAQGAPPLQTAKLRFQFPDVTLTLDDALGNRRLLTNRDQVRIGYRFSTAAAETLDFEYKGVTLAPKTKVELGLPLEPFVTGAWLSRKEESGKWIDELLRRVHLCDASGRPVNLGESNFDFQCDFSFKGSRVAHNDNRRTVIDGRSFRPEQVTASLNYRFGGRAVNRITKASGWKTLTSEHFKTDSLPAMRKQAKAFLQMAEVVRRIDASLCQRRGPELCYIKWRGDVWNAESTIGKREGGDTELWMSFPFEAIERFKDFFVEPDFHGNGDPFVAHELLHAFGYEHSDEMSRLELLAEETFRQLRWSTVDTGKWPIWDE